MEDAVHELHSALEQLATSKEELQATNEELTALDDENRRRVQELIQLSTDLQHLLAASGIATLFLDRELNIVRFTPEVSKLFGLRLSDLGRPISDLAAMTWYAEFVADAGRVLTTAERWEREMRSADERWYLIRLLPYRTEICRADGVVLTFIDITERKRAEQILEEANRHKDESLALQAFDPKRESHTQGRSCAGTIDGRRGCGPAHPGPIEPAQQRGEIQPETGEDRSNGNL